MSSLIRWRPWTELAPWRPWGGQWGREFEEFLQDLDEWELPSLRTEAVQWAPRIESYEKDGNYFVKADLPGVDPKDIHVEVEGSCLKISGERKMDKEVQEKDLRRREMFYGSFKRYVPIPEGLKSEAIKAKYHDGVLEISVPLEKTQLRKEIKIETQEPRLEEKAA